MCAFHTCVQEDVFPVEMRDVGRPTYLIVRSDGSSKKPTWHLDMVIVECSLVCVRGGYRE